MDLASYRERIGYSGTVRPDLACLNGIHLCHALSVPYENLDIQLGIRVGLDPEAAFHKIVTRRRGGWCYELHQLLGWALGAIGFEVQLVVAGIERVDRGDAALGDHSALLVRFDRTYLVDLGLGDGLRLPVALIEGTAVQGELAFGLSRVDGAYWRFRNHASAIPASFDFADRPADLEVLAARGSELQTAPDSIFVKNLICQKMRRNSVLCLTGRILREKSAAGVQKRLVLEEEFEGLIAREFGLSVPGLARLWPQVAERHRALFGDARAEEIDYAGF